MAVLGGAAIALQPPTNALLARASGSLPLTGLISFAVGALALFVVWLLTDCSGISSLHTVPASGWLGGLYGATFVCAGAYAAPRIGLGTTVVAMIAGQLLVAMALDHYGLLGLEPVRISSGRAGGIVLVLVGALLLKS